MPKAPIKFWPSAFSLKGQLLKKIQPEKKYAQFKRNAISKYMAKNVSAKPHSISNIYFGEKVQKTILALRSFGNFFLYSLG